MSERTTRDGTRIVLYRANHPETHQPGWAGFVENGLCVHLGWYPNHFAVARAARRAARRKDRW